MLSEDKVIQYPTELWNEDGECFIIKEKYTMEEAVFLSKDYEDETFPYTDDPAIVYMRPADAAEIEERGFEPGWYMELDKPEPNSVAYWKFVPNMSRDYAALEGEFI